MGTEEGKNSPQSGAPRQIAFFTCLLLAASGACLGIHWLLDAAGLKLPGTNHFPAFFMQKNLPKTARLPEKRRIQQVGFLGDSTVISYDPGKKLPRQLRNALASKGYPPRRVRVTSLALAGMGAFDFYFLADEIADAQHDVIVMPLNLASMSRPWRDSFSRPELAGWVRPSRLPEAFALPLHWIGLTTDRLLLYVGMVQTGLFPTWRYVTRDQARTGSARELIEERIAGFFSGWPEDRVRQARNLHLLRAYMDLPRKRFAAPIVRTHWGTALDGVSENNPVLQALGAAVRRLHDADISVIVYVIPINVEHVEAKGLLDTSGIRQTIDSAKRVVVRSGGTFVDLHDLFPDHGFRDAPGHFQSNEEFEGTEKVAKALAPFVIESMSRSARRRD